jgi:hypothetical protein
MRKVPANATVCERNAFRGTKVPSGRFRRSLKDSWPICGSLPAFARDAAERLRGRSPGWNRSRRTPGVRSVDARTTSLPSR